ncbi:MAG: DUF1549 domain-containing protein [Pirellulaceae bacterium]
MAFRVARHPSRDEIVVGSADGVPKLYRVFRETKRVIGDDANLLRTFPQMDGRLQAVCISSDGKLVAFASGLDGNSQVRVYSLEFDTTVPADIKAINSKVVSSRNGDEVTRLNQFHELDIQEVARFDFSDLALYSLDFSKDGSRLYAGGNDGELRELELSTSQVTELAVHDVTANENGVAQSNVYPRMKEQPVSPGVETLSINFEGAELEVFPDALSFESARDYCQLVVRLRFDDGTSVDVTNRAQISGANDLVVVSSTGLVEVNGTSGSGELKIEFGNLQSNVSCRVAIDDPRPVSFIQDVNPVMGKLGCNAGTCHGSQAGKRGFKLSLRGYDPLFDIRALTDDLASRRINTAAPEGSLMLTKASGGVPHEGGVILDRDGKYYQLVSEWIRSGAKLDLDSPRVQRITIEPTLPVLKDAGSRQQMRVVAHYSDGMTRDVTREAFVETANQEVVTVDSFGVATAARRGEAAILARYEGAFVATTLTVMGDRSGFEWVQPVAFSPIDELVANKWQRMKIQPAELCNDYEFVRRIHLDLTGLPPTPDVIRAFINDPRPTREKREAMVDALIGSSEFVDYWTSKWSDLLQVNEKFLGSEGAVKFHRWIREQVDANVPYDQFVHSILTASGSNAENPAASYFKILRTPEDAMENTTHLFLSTRFNCNKCHDHPFERWTQDQYYETAAYFAQIDRKRAPESGDRNIGGSAVESATPLFETIADIDSGEVIHDRTKKITAPAFPYGKGNLESGSTSRRERLANWIVDPANPYFASSYANRVWGQLMGMGLIEPVDDTRASNPPTNPQLLQYLTKEFVDSKFDVQHLIRTICNSRTYQLAATTNKYNEDDTLNYSHALPRRLNAEVLFDSLYFVCGSQPQIPGAKLGTRAMQLPNPGGALKNSILATLGQPVRESACECERSNDLHLGSVLALVSGPDQASAINNPESEIVRLTRNTSANEELIRGLYLRVLGRPARDDEVVTMSGMFDEVVSDHQKLVEQLKEHRDQVEPEFIRVESERKQKLSDTQSTLNAKIAELAPELLQQEADQKARVESLQQELVKFETAIDDEVQKWRELHLSQIQWHPILPRDWEQTNGGQLELLDDRSIITRDPMGATVTRLTTQTDLSRVSAIRLETLKSDELPGGGPGLAENGNFVVHQFVLEMNSSPTSDEWTRLELIDPMADFEQAGFPINGTVDGDETQTGWAVVPEIAKNHWATFQLKTPVAPTAETRFRISMVQNYGGNHQLGRFRISFSSSSIPVGISVSDELLTTLVREPAQWSEASKMQFQSLVRNGSPRRKMLEEELMAASQPLDVPEEVIALRQEVERLSIETPKDMRWLTLERDVETSARQMESSRVTIAQDLVWALINSPEFLFNH